MRAFTVGATALLLTSTTIAAPATLDIPRSNATIIKATQQVLQQEGFEIPLADPAGNLKTRPKPMRLTVEDADCGKVFGISYLRDKRASTNVAITVTAQNQRMTLTAHVDGTYLPNGPGSDQKLNCLSRGSVEQRLANTIQQAALSMEDAPTPVPAIIEATVPPEKSDEPEVKLAANPKTPEEAVELFNIELQHEEVNYRNAVTLNFSYQSKTSKKIIGIITDATISNAFGKLILTQRMADEIAIDPGALKESDKMWHWDNNQFIANEPYDLMWQSVKNGTAQLKTRLIRVVFADGTSVEAKAAAPTRKKR